jgi:hypothetical protein
MGLSGCDASTAKSTLAPNITPSPTQLSFNGSSEAVYIRFSFGSATKNRKYVRQGGEGDSSGTTLKTLLIPGAQVIVTAIEHELSISRLI